MIPRAEDTLYYQKEKMIQRSNSIELLPLPESDVEQSPSSETSPTPLPKPTTAILLSWRWREIVTAAFIIVEFFFVTSTVSLIGVFFPAEVCR